MAVLQPILHARSSRVKKRQLCWPSSALWVTQNVLVCGAMAAECVHHWARGPKLLSQTIPGPPPPPTSMKTSLRPMAVSSDMVSQSGHP